MKTGAKILAAAGLVLVAFLAFGAYVGSTPEGKARTREREVIAACWRNQGGKSLSPGGQRSVASVCERLEAEFRTKWRREP